MVAVPDYIRIAQEITDDVRSGRLKPGDKLPSIAELSGRHGVSSSTIQLTFVRLEAIEAIIRKQGKGVYVTDPETWLRKPGT